MWIYTSIKKENLTSKNSYYNKFDLRSTLLKMDLNNQQPGLTHIYTTENDHSGKDTN